MRTRLTTTLLTAAVAIAAAGCTSTTPRAATGPVPAGPSTSATAAPEGDAPAPEGDRDRVPVVPAEAGHVHGIAVNPADDRVYLGTHEGTYRVDVDAVTRVGDHTLDLMGFTAAGPDHFYSSGHPGPADNLPNPVGLLQTTDAGKTWAPLSLTGTTDFHTLGAAGNHVYGYDGAIRHTADGRTWDTGATDISPVSLSVDPANGARVIATTEHGPVRSTNTGQSFTHLDGAPLLVFVAWAAPGHLYGISPDGHVHHSADGGTTWTARGTTTQPAAFAAGPDGAVAVATSTELLTSTDGGATFTPVATLQPGGH